ncbi:MAG: RHS repeat protein, partial [bacterium]|nr:RHS repeat protein [bacterium]
TEFGYDVLGRLRSVQNALELVTSYTYDEVGNRLTQTDANGHAASFRCDALGRRTQALFTDGSVETMTYNADGTLASYTDLKGVTRTFEYDTNQRLTRRAYPDGSAVTFTYAAMGQRATATDARGITSYTYDSRGQLLEKTDPTGHKLSYAYDPQGGVIGLTATVGPQVFSTSYTYDALNRLATVTDAQGDVTTLSYDVNGNRATLQHPNGVTTTTAYDALNRLTNLATETSVGDVLQSYQYTLGAAGKHTRVDEHDGTSRHYHYDALHRLTQDRVTDPASALVYQRDFVYDPVGNRLLQTIADDSGTTRVASTYDTRDRLLSADAATYGWDANGNLVSQADGQSTTYGWDSEDRLATVVLADGTVVETTYDVDGHRVRTAVTQPGGSVNVVDYLVDTTGFLSHVVAEVVGGQVAILYTRAGDRLISLYRPGGTTKRYYHADGLGSVRVLSDEAGSVTDRYTYSAFGELLEHAGSDPQPYQFAGESFDPDSELYYNRARWLEPATGRFISRDPVRGIVTDPQSLHSYTYSHLDPVNNLDPSGQFTVVQVLVAFTVLGMLSAIPLLDGTPPGRLPPTPLRLRLLLWDQTLWTPLAIRTQLETARRILAQARVFVDWPPGPLEWSSPSKYLGNIGRKDIKLGIMTAFEAVIWARSFDEGNGEMPVFFLTAFHDKMAHGGSWPECEVREKGIALPGFGQTQAALAHEIGHNMCLPDRPESDGKTFLMMKFGGGGAFLDERERYLINRNARNFNAGRSFAKW